MTDLNEPADRWRPIETAPIETEIRVLLDDGREAVAEYWPPAPVEIDPRQVSGGWAICLLGSGSLDLGLDCKPIGELTHWRPFAATPVPEEHHND